NYLTVEWDVRYDFKSFLHDNNTEWRLDFDCHNEYCDFCLGATFANEDIPPLFMPKDWVDIEHAANVIRKHYPCYSQIFQGLLYATASTHPYLVPVPAEDGVASSCTLEKLQVNYWVHQRAFGTTTVSCRALRHRYNALPNFMVPLDNVYTFFFEDETNNPPPNSLINDIAPNATMDARFDGNLLVMKEHQGLLVNITTDDIGLISFLLKRWLSFAHSVQLYLCVLTACQATANTTSTCADVGLKLAFLGLAYYVYRSSRMCYRVPTSLLMKEHFRLYHSSMFAPAVHDLIEIYDHVGSFIFGSQLYHKPDLLKDMIQTLANDVTVSVVFAESDTLASYLVAEAVKEDHAPYVSGSGILMVAFLQSHGGQGF
ncbi:hypothetical protein EV702DRAFT_1053778, partial [Suillus placidus]